MNLEKDSTLNYLGQPDSPRPSIAYSSVSFSFIQSEKLNGFCFSNFSSLFIYSFSECLYYSLTLSISKRQNKQLIQNYSVNKRQDHDLHQHSLTPKSIYLLILLLLAVSLRHIQKKVNQTTKITFGLKHVLNNVTIKIYYMKFPHSESHVQDGLIYFSSFCS